jgi:hypothetical protein
MPARRYTVSDIYTADHNRLPSVDCDAFGLTADVLGIKVWVIPLLSGDTGSSADASEYPRERLE